MQKIVLFIALFGFFSCEMKVKELPAPSNLLPKEKLIPVLEELMIAEQFIQARYPQIDQFREIAKKSGDEILKKHGISFKQFDEAMDYYGSRQKEMQEIYNQILENINHKLNKL